MDTKTAPKQIRANNFKHWENDNSSELLVCVGSDANTKAAKWFLEEEYRLSWVQESLGKVKENGSIVSPWFLYGMAKDRTFHANPNWSKDDQLYFPLDYKVHIDDQENQNYRPPVVLTNSDLRKGNKQFLNMEQQSVRFLLVGKLPDDCKNILVDQLKKHRIKNAKVDSLFYASNDEYHDDRYLRSHVKTIHNLTQEMEIYYKEYWEEAGMSEGYSEETHLPKRADSCPVDDVVYRLNETFVRVTSNGKNYVTRRGIDNLGRTYLEFFTYKDFREYFIHEPEVETGEIRNNQPVTKNPAQIWLEDERSIRSEYGVTFYPKDIQFYKGRLNAYTGLGIIPTEYDMDVIQPYLDHVRNVICSENETYYEYVLNWCAHMLQVPEEKPETAIVLKAAPGTGKGTFVKPLGKIMGSHYLHAYDAKHVVGKFNKAMENKILVFGDEFFSGSKEASDKLKGKITEDTQTIERKGIDTIETPDFARVILASNHENIVRIEVDDRRYLFLEVSDVVKQNHDYFGKLGPLVGSERFAAMLADFLLKRDITGFNPRAVPKTKALAQQKLDNLEPLDKWILHCLRVGSFTSKASIEARVNTNEINRIAKEWLDGEKLSVYGDLSRKLGIALNGLAKRKRLRTSDGLIYVYEFRKLDEMRGYFNRKIGYEIEY